MAAQPPPSSSSSSRRTRTGDKSVGSFTIEDEIGKGSFATVYRGTHKVCLLVGAPMSLESISDETFSSLSSFSCAPVLIPISAGYRSSRCYQISQPSEAQQEAQGEPLLRNRDPQRPPPSSHRCPDRLPRVIVTYTFGDGVL